MIKTLRRILCIATGITACAGDVASPRATFTGDVLWKIELNVHRAVLSVKPPYDTLRLVATPRSASGRVLSDVGETSFAVSDLTLSVSPDGLVTALKPAARSFVVATLRDTIAHVTHVDTVFITVTEEETPARVATVSIHPVAGDSAKTSQDSLKTMAFIVTDSTGHNVTDQVPRWFLSRDPDVLRIDRESGLLTSGIPERSTIIVAEVSYYGVIVRDSVSFSVGYPLMARIEGGPENAVASAPFVLSPSRTTIGVGGSVVFRSTLVLRPDFLGWLSGVPFDVRFDNPSAALPSPLTVDFATPLVSGTGDIETLQYPGALFQDAYTVCDTARCAAARSFHTPGTYPFHDSRSGASGVITVK